MGKSREQTIENILEAAKKNLERVDMMVQVSKKLQKEAKVNVAMVSYYFNGKENLYLEVFKNMVLQKLPNFLEETKHNPKTALRQYLNFFYTHIKQHPEIGTLAYEAIIKESSQLEKIKPYIIGNFGQLKEILLEGRNKGFFISFRQTMLFIGLPP